MTPGNVCSSTNNTGTVETVETRRACIGRGVMASWGHGVMGATMANAGQRGKFRFVWPAKMRETSKMVRARCMFARNDVGYSVTSP